ncbi:hypothetical protein [Oerskovia enterophila]|uniref:hypothetical protein n=1 Tax=Oerskovia enterophila TaxID=43678 RepID=UPI0038278DA6
MIVREALSTIESFSIKAGVGPVSGDLTVKTSGRADSGNIEMDLEDLVADVVPALRDESIGMALFVDEIQDLDSSTLTALLAAQHRAAQNDWPFYVFGQAFLSYPRSWPRRVRMQRDSSTTATSTA